MNKVKLFLKKYCTKKNIQENFFLILACLVFVWFLFYAFDEHCYNRCRVEWEWYTFRKCLLPCFCLVFLHYLSKIARSFAITEKNKEENK